jgi:hypothetical protein
MTRTGARSGDARSSDDGHTGSGTSRASRWLLGGIGAGALAVVTVVLVQRGDEPRSVPEQVTAAYIDAWNARDAQAVSGLTCQWVGAFTPAGVVEDQLAFAPHDGPVIADYTFTGTETVTVDHRELDAVHVHYVRGGEGRTRETTVFVRQDADHEPCIASFTTW